MTALTGLAFAGKGDWLLQRHSPLPLQPSQPSPARSETGRRAEEAEGADGAGQAARQRGSEGGGVEESIKEREEEEEEEGGRTDGTHCRGDSGRKFADCGLVPAGRVRARASPRTKFS